ncbi:MAG: 50S ribosomal protein L25 [Acidobacteria bacterium]|nr:50S ribosomal protein L25 [Acidobacteriota bacterium]
MSLDSNISLTARNRTEFGKNASRRLRAAGLVPVTVYGGGNEATSATVAKRDFAALIRHHGRNVIFTLDVEGNSGPVKISDVQIDPIKGFLVHADLMRISLTEKSKFEVRIKIVGEADGVKNFGGFMDVPTHSLEIRCLPKDLPSVIEVDVTSLGVGDHFSVKDLNLGDKIELLDDPNKVIATVVAPRGEEAAESSAEAAEPEVMKKGKAEEEK